jgi:uncharacterized protein (DUF433 family)
MNWSGCPVVVSRRGYISGAPALRDDPRVPADAVVVNMDDNLTAQEVAELFDLRTPIDDIQAVYNYAKRQRVPGPV